MTAYRIGIFLIISALLVLFSTFLPATLQELKYTLKRPQMGSPTVLVDHATTSPPDEQAIYPANLDFTVIVPKIGANVPVIANVDPQNSREYQKALKEGVAQAKGSALPDQSGNTFLFAHSSQNLAIANRYNAVFYLLHKLQKDDDFYLVYRKQIYHYKVSEVKKVAPSSFEYVAGNQLEHTATLMTCWPPGTTLQRLLVIGTLQSE